MEFRGICRNRPSRESDTSNLPLYISNSYPCKKSFLWITVETFDCRIASPVQIIQGFVRCEQIELPKSCTAEAGDRLADLADCKTGEEGAG